MSPRKSGSATAVEMTSCHAQSPATRRGRCAAARTPAGKAARARVRTTVTVRPPASTFCSQNIHRAVQEIGEPRIGIQALRVVDPVHFQRDAVFGIDDGRAQPPRVDAFDLRPRRATVPRHAFTTAILPGELHVDWERHRSRGAAARHVCATALRRTRLPSVPPPFATGRRFHARVLAAAALARLSPWRSRSR